MQVTSCSGSESSLLSCSHTQLGSDPSCNALNEVGVRCIGMLATSLLIYVVQCLMTVRHLIILYQNSLLRSLYTFSFLLSQFLQV